MRRKVEALRSKLGGSGQWTPEGVNTRENAIFLTLGHVMFLNFWGPTSKTGPKRPRGSDTVADDPTPSFVQSMFLAPRLHDLTPFWVC
jgi:hypothetical protein